MTSIGSHEDLNHETLRNHMASHPDLSPYERREVQTGPLSDDATRLGRALRRISEINARVEELETQLIKAQSDLVDRAHVILNLKGNADKLQAEIKRLREKHKDHE